MAVFLTGATGFLGRNLARRMLEGGEEIVALVRCGTPEEGLERMRAALIALGTQPGSDLSRRLHIVPGALDRPGLGLAAGDRARVLATCDRFLHCGASVRFDLPLAEARSINVAGTREMLALARERQRAEGLARFDYVSTAYVAGRRTGLVLEKELDGRAGHRNSYEASKFEAESIVARTRGELPVAVFRPSIVAGDSRKGVTSSFNMIYWPIRVYASGIWRTLPGLRTAPLDIVPVDFVADAILALARRGDTLGGTFHLTAGSEGEITLGEIADRVESFFPERKPIRFFDPARWMRWVDPVVSRLGFGSARYVVRNAAGYLPYLIDSPHFDTAQASAALSDAGLEPPRVGDYLERLLRYCVESDWGRRTPA